MSSQIEAGRAFVIIAAIDKTKAVLDKIGKNMSDFGGKITAVGAGMSALTAPVLATIGASTKHFADFGSKLVDMSDRTGLSVESLSLLGHAADQTGTNIDDVAVGIKKMSSAVFEARNGSSEMQTALGSLGIDVKDLEKMSAHDIFMKIGTAIGKINDPIAKSAMAVKMFGKSGTSLLPMLKGLGENAEKAKNLGLIVTTAEAQKADALGDAFDWLKSATKALSFQIGSAVAGEITAIMDKMTVVVSGAVRWVKANQEIVATIARVAKYVAIAGSIIASLGTGVWAAGFALKQMLGTFQTFGVILKFFSPFVAIISSIFSVVAAGFAFIAPAIPIVIALAAAIGAVYLAISSLGDSGNAIFSFLGEVGSMFGSVFSSVVQVVRDAFNSVLSFLAPVGEAFNSLFGGIPAFFQQQFGALYDIASQVFDAIVQLVMKGDLSGAIEILTLGMKTLWAQGLAGMITAWIEFKRLIIEVFYGAVVTIKTMWFELQKSISQSILKLAQSSEFFNKIFEKISGVNVQEESARTDRLNAEAARRGLATGPSFADQASSAIDQQFDDLISRSREDAGRQLSGLNDSLDKQKEDAQKQADDLRIELGNTIGMRMDAVTTEGLKLPDEGLKVEGLSSIGPAVAKVPDTFEKGSKEAAKKINEQRNTELLSGIKNVLGGIKDEVAGLRRDNQENGFEGVG